MALVVGGVLGLGASVVFFERVCSSVRGVDGSGVWGGVTLAVIRTVNSALTWFTNWATALASTACPRNLVCDG